VGSLVLPSSGAILASTDNPDGADQLLGFLTEDRAQAYFADENQEYPLAGSDAVSLEDAFPFPGTSADLAEVVNLISESGIGQ
jgi:ABC-type Fe3+ transport system substrate-binding protein